MLTSPTVTVFVYGTLRAGECNHARLGDATFQGTAVTAPRYTLVDLGGFPGLLAGGTTAVHGEVYGVDAPTLASLDYLEGHPRFYTRQTVDLADGRTVEAYVLPARYAVHPPITSGDWCAHRAARRAVAAAEV